MPNELEWLNLKDHCEMCGFKDRLEAAFDPGGQPKTLCYSCRIGSAELLADTRVAMYNALREIHKFWLCPEPKRMRDWSARCDVMNYEAHKAIAIAEGRAVPRRSILDVMHEQYIADKKIPDGESQ